jgi:hypothetical protein
LDEQIKYIGIETEILQNISGNNNLQKRQSIKEEEDELIKI